jgi:hypothetical protein
MLKPFQMIYTIRFRVTCWLSLCVYYNLYGLSLRYFLVNLASNILSSLKWCLHYGDNRSKLRLLKMQKKLFFKMHLAESYYRRSVNHPLHYITLHYITLHYIT